MLNLQFRKIGFERILKFLLGLFLFLLPWQTIWIFREVFVGGVKMEWWTLGFYVTEGLLWVVIVLFILWYWRLFRAKFSIFNFQFSKDRIFVFSIFSFVVYCLLSIFWSREPSLALQQSLHVMEAFLLFFIILLGPLKKEEAIKWLVLGSVLPCILGIWQFLAQSTFASTLLGLASHPAWQGGTSVVASETVGRWLRAYGPFSHPNLFGGYLVIVLMCLATEHGVWKMENGTKGKIVFHVVCSMLCVSLFFTFSRSAWVAAVVCILYPVSCILFSRKCNYNRLQVMGYMLQIMFLLILFITFFPLVQTRLTGDSATESYSINDRVSGYSDAWKLFKQHPALGVGAGNYTLYEAQPAHNVFVLFIVETGVVGVLLFFILVFCFCNLYPISCNLFFGHRAGYMLQVVGFLILALLDHYLYSSYAGLMMSALFFGLISRKNCENTVSPQLVHRELFDTPDTACHNTPTPASAKATAGEEEPIVGAGA